MRLIGTLLLVTGVAVAWLLGIEGLQPQDAIAHVRATLRLPNSA